MNVEQITAAQRTYLDDDFRQVFRNLDTTERVRRINIDRWVKYCKDAGASSVTVDIKNFLVLYDSRFLPKHPVLGGRDVAAEVAAAARKHGLKWLVYYAAPCQMDGLAGLHDDWQQRTADGSLEAVNWRSRALFCLNRPGFRDLVAASLREISEKYRPHGYYIDNCGLGHTACFCDACKAKYLEQTGKPMPLKPDWESPDWYAFITWRYGELEQMNRLLHDSIKGVDPRIAIIGNTHYFANGWYAGHSPKAARWLDYACTEMFPGCGGSIPNFTYGENLTWGLTANRAIKNGSLAHSYAWFGANTPRAEAVTHYNLTLAAGAVPCVQECCHHLPALMRRVRQTEPYLKEIVSAADVAMHYSSLAHTAYYRPQNHAQSETFFAECQGLFKAMLNSHIPVEVIHDDWLADLDISRFRTIVLPNSVCLKPQIRKRLMEYVENGGTILATLETGLRDECGRRQGTDLLWPESGLTFKGDIDTIPQVLVSYPKPTGCEMEDNIAAVPDQYLVFKSHGEVKAWIGEDNSLDGRFEGIEAREGAQLTGVPSCHLPTKAVQIAAGRDWEVLAKLRFRRDKGRGWEECPAVVRRRLGRGCVTYANFQLGSLTSAAGFPLPSLIGHPWWRRLTAKLVEETSGRTWLRVQAPTCVKCFVWRQPSRKRHVIHLVNELSSSGMLAAQREDHVPVPAKVRITLPGLRSVKAAIGGKDCRIRRSGRQWLVAHPGIVERLVLVCQGEIA